MISAIHWVRVCAFPTSNGGLTSICAGPGAQRGGQAEPGKIRFGDHSCQLVTTLQLLLDQGQKLVVFVLNLAGLALATLPSSTVRVLRGAGR